MSEVLDLIARDPKFPNLVARHMQGRLAFDTRLRRGNRVIWIDLLAIEGGAYALTVDPWTGPEKIICSNAQEAVTAIKRELRELQGNFPAAQVAP